MILHFLVVLFSHFNLSLKISLITHLPQSIHTCCLAFELNFLKIIVIFKILTCHFQHLGYFIYVDFLHIFFSHLIWTRFLVCFLCL